MRVLTLRTCESRNIHCHRPVLCVQLDLEDLAGLETTDIPGFTQRLVSLIPGLAEHHCSTGRRGGFIERMTEGILFGHVVEHVVLELQVRAGLNVIYGKTRSTSRPAVFDVVVECMTPGAAARAVEAAVTIVDRLSRGLEAEVDPHVNDIARIHGTEAIGPSTQAIADAAARRGIPVIRLSGSSLLQLGYGAGQRRVWATMTDRTGSLAVDIAGDKMLAKKLLENAGLPVPRGGIATDDAAALALAESIGGTVAIKPYNGNQGKGVSLNLVTGQEIVEAFALARNYSDKIMVEQFIPGRHYRILVVGDAAVAASERIPAHVIGDGKHSIKELVDLLNMDPKRGDGHERPLTRIKIDPVVLTVLARQNLTIDYVPRFGETVFLRHNANLSTGGTAIDVTGQMHRKNAELAIHAALAIGLDVAGVDIVATDIALPITRREGAIIEVNASPGIRMHLHPSAGAARPVGEDIVRMMFPVDIPHFPIIAVTGTNGKTSTVRLIAAVLAAAGLTVGMATTDGVFIGGRKVATGDLAGPTGTRMVLSHKQPEAAVFELARGGLIRQGLAYDLADVAIVTNVQTDHVGQDGIETMVDLIGVKSLIVEAVRPDGAVVLNADDPAAPLITERAAAPVTYVSTSATNPIIASHTGQGGSAVVVSDGSLTLIEGDVRRKLMAANDIPIAHGGLCEAGLANALCAAAACWRLGLTDDVIRTGLGRLEAQLNGNRGRLNLVSAADRRILIDYGHNPPAFAAAGRLARQLAGGCEVVAVVGVPGDRTDEQIIASGEMAAVMFDRLFIKEDADRRGRAPGEVASLLTLGTRRSGFPQSRVCEILDEGEAVAQALRLTPVESLVVVFYESLATVTRAIEAVCGCSLEECVTDQAGTRLLP